MVLFGITSAPARISGGQGTLIGNEGTFCTRGHWGQLGSRAGPGQGPVGGSDSNLLISKATNKHPECNFVISASKKDVYFFFSHFVEFRAGQGREGHNDFGAGC